MNTGGRERVERRLAAILAADVVGYSRLMGEDEEGTLERLKAHRSRLVDLKIKEHRGRIVKTTGDGLLVEFASVVDAVSCAVEVQRGMVERNSDIPEDQRILWRVGINLGDVIIDGDDIHGDGVNVAARLEALAEPGGICIERTVRNQVRDKLPYSFEDMGEQSVKNIARPVRAYAMGAAAVTATPLTEVRLQAQAPPGLARRSIIPRPAMIAISAVVLIASGLGAWWVWPLASKSPQLAQAPGNPTSPPAIASSAAISAPRLSIVVLPFANLSNDPQQDYFVDAITEDLTTDLSRIAGSFVISRNTAFTYRGKPVDAKQIGRDLGVRYILEGSVQKAGDRVQVNAQLIDSDTGAHVWADRFETDRTRLAEAQNDITGRLARALDLALVKAVSQRIEREAAVNPNAQDLVMRGRAAFYRPNTQPNREEAQRLFEEALELDPHSVEARIGVARVLIRQIGTFVTGEDQEPRIERLLLGAVEDDPGSALGHAYMGQLRRFQNRLTESRVELETALALDANNLVAINQLGWTLLFLGEPQKSIPLAEQSLRLSPRDENMWGAYLLLGNSHLFLNELDPAIDALIKSRAANRDPWPTPFLLAAALALKDEKAEAQEALAGGLKLKPDHNSVAVFRVGVAWTHHPKFVALSEATFVAGLLRAGLPEK